MALSEADKAILKGAAAIIQRELAEDGDSVSIYGFGTFRRSLPILQANPGRARLCPSFG